MSQLLSVELQTDAIFTLTGATVGHPASLDRVPGATLLGAAAQRLFAELGPDAVRVFTLGAVRFGDGLPVADGRIAVPTPLSWHQEKGKSRVIDLSLADRPPGQWSQIRTGWWVPDDDNGWRRVDVHRRSSMRTAIDEGGRAREGLLFGFEAVGASAVFASRLDGADPELVARVSAALRAGPVRLGRSRSAEFGEARVRSAPELERPGERREPAAPGLVRVLLLSDLCLVDVETGGPRLLPGPHDLGLDATWRLDLDRSFVRFRRYSPFNGHRRRPDPERQVVVAGSVLTFRGPGLDAGALRTMRDGIAGGVGQHLGSGLGEVLVEPEILASAGPVLREAQPAREVVSFPTALATDPLAAWMRRSADETRALDAAWRRANEAAGASVFARVTKAQWGWLRGWAAEKRLAPGGDLRAPAIRASVTQQLAEELERQFVRGIHQKAWRGAARLVLEFLAREAHHPPLHPAHAVELLAAQVARRIAAAKGGAE